MILENNRKSEYGIQEPHIPGNFMLGGTATTEVISKQGKQR